MITLIIKKKTSLVCFNLEKLSINKINLKAIETKSYNNMFIILEEQNLHV